MLSSLPAIYSNFGKMTVQDQYREWNGSDVWLLYKLYKFLKNHINSQGMIQNTIKSKTFHQINSSIWLN